MLKELGLPVFYVPGEHDMLDPDGGKAFLNRFGKGSQGAGWYSFDHRGVHFVALVNVADLKPGGMGNLGSKQLAWLKGDLVGRPSSQPIVVFAHIPLWTVYADWGWGTDDATEALKLLARFGSVTVLNGHIHQITQKVEGRIAFHTARSTAFPQPAPGTAPSPGPLKVPTEQLHSMLGITDASFVRGHDRIALVDSTANADHPMINPIWRGRLAIGDVLVPLRPGDPVVPLVLGALKLRTMIREPLRRAVHLFRKRQEKSS
jgi:hypothetical protein